MATKASIINNALRLLGEPESMALDETRKPVKKCLNAWDDVVASRFEDHDWNFSSSTVLLSSVLPALDGWDYTFNKPAACVRLLKVTNATDFERPSIDFEDRGGRILTNSETTYAKYIDKTYYTQVGSWSQKFADMVAAWLADEVHPSTDESDAVRVRIGKAVDSRTVDAKALDARGDPVYRQPAGAFVTARIQGIRTSRNY